MSKVCNKCLTDRPLDDFHKNSKSKDGLYNICKICRKTLEKTRYSNNREKILLQKQEYYFNNKDTLLEKHKEYYISNRDILLKQKQKYYLENLADCKLVRKIWRERKYLEDSSFYIKQYLKRRLHIGQASPSWANQDSINHIYSERDRISKKTGIIHHVDHVIPLKGKLVSGLHVETNLRIITAKENLQKQAKFIEDLL
jgi:hypothetical protein